MALLCGIKVEGYLINCEANIEAWEARDEELMNRALEDTS